MRVPSSRMLGAVALAAAAIAAVAWFVASPPARRVALAPAIAPAPAAAPRAVSTEVAEVAPESAERATAARGVAPVARERSDSFESARVDLSGAHWVEGRVLFPPGTPADEEAFVVADGRDFDDGSDHRARVEAGGEFRVAFRSTTRTGKLRLQARYLRLEEPRTWTRDEQGPITLEPSLGGRLEVRLVPPAGSALSEAGGLVKISSKLTDSERVYDALAARSVDEVGQVEFDALEPELEHRLEYRGPRFVSDGSNVEVRAGSTRQVELALRPGLVVAGRVVDEAGVPLARVEVGAFLRSGGRGTVGAGAKSDEDGRFRLDALDPGTVTVRASLPGYVQLEEAHEPPPLGGPLELVLVLQRGHTIAGRVTWPDGTPAEAHLRFTPLPDGDSRTGEDTVDVTAAADGGFLAGGLEAPAYHVRASATHEREVPDVSAVTGRERTRTERSLWSVEVERVDAGAAGLELVLGPGLAVRGVVRDESGAPLDDVRVTSQRRSFPSEQWDPDAGPNGRFRNADGTFELSGFQPGTWALLASARGRVACDPVEVQLPGAGPIELVLAREAVVRGVVLDTDGAPAPRARVRAVQPDHEVARVRVFDQEIGDRTDESGAFEIDGLRGGRTILEVEAANGSPGESLEVELAAGQTLAGVVLHLQPPCAIEGVIVDRAGLPVAGQFVAVNVQEREASESTTSDDEGRFAFRRLPEGDAWLWSTSSEGLALNARVELRAGETAHVRLEPPASAPVRLHGRVLSGGAPIGGAQVAAQREGADWGQAGTYVQSPQASDAEGRYEVLLPGSGRWLVHVQGEGVGFGQWSVPVDVPEVDALERDLSLELGRVQGRVRGADGAPLAGVHVRSEPHRHDGGPRGSATAETDAEGRYELAVPVGEHAIVAGGDTRWTNAAPGWCTARVEGVRIAAGEVRKGVDFTLRRGGTLAGVVRGPTGSALANAIVAAGEDATQWTWTDAHGSFRVEGLEPGTLWVRASHAERFATAQAVQVAIRAGEEARVELELVPAVLARVRVLDAAGAPLGCEIEARDESGRSVTQQSNGEMGSVRLGPLPPGSYRVTARREEKLAQRTLDVTGLEGEIELTLGFD